MTFRVEQGLVALDPNGPLALTEQERIAGLELRLASMEMLISAWNYHFNLVDSQIEALEKQRPLDAITQLERHRKQDPELNFVDVSAGEVTVDDVRIRKVISCEVSQKIGLTEVTITFLANLGPKP